MKIVQKYQQKFLNIFQLYFVKLMWINSLVQMRSKIVAPL